MNIKCLAVDDEPLALTQLTGYISRVPFLELVATCQDAFQATAVLSQNEIDLLFVDINMPDLNGLDFVRSLAVKPMVIFTTAYPEYAVEGFKVEAVDYLLKPFDFNDLMKSAVKAYRNFENQSNASMGSLFIKTSEHIIRISIPEIVYVELAGGSTGICLANESQPLVVPMTLDAIEERLPAHSFMRVHQGYIVNLHRIVSIARMRIVMPSGTYIPIGEEFKEKFSDYINRLSIKK